MDAANPGDTCVIAGLETSHETQRTARPETLSTTFERVEYNVSVCVRVGVGGEALGWRVEDGNK